MITEETIGEDPLIMDFFLNRELGEGSRGVYIQRITLYCKYVELNPTELIEEAERESDEGIKPRNRRIKRHLLGFREHLKEKGNSTNYIKNAIGTVRTFYKEYEIDLPHINNGNKREKKIREEIPKKDDIKKMLGYANLKYEAMIKLMMSSGMGGAEVRELNIKHLLEAFELPINDRIIIKEIIDTLRKKEDKIGVWDITRVRTNFDYYTFNSPEALEAVLDYLSWRETHHPVTTPEDYLFEVKGLKMKLNTLEHAFADMSDKAELGYCKLGNNNPYHFGHPHSLRKFFATTVNDGYMQDLDSEWLLGHDIGDTKGRYKRPDNVKRLKKEYLKVLPYLSIAPVKTITIESDEVKEIKKQYSGKLSSMTDEINLLKKRIEEEKVKQAEFRDYAIEEMGKRSAKLIIEEVERQLNNKKGNNDKLTIDEEKLLTALSNKSQTE